MKRGWLAKNWRAEHGEAGDLAQTGIVDVDFRGLCVEVTLTAHPDFTAMGLIALRACGVHADPAVRSAEDYLASRLAASEATYSLAWALLALRNNPKVVSTLRAQLLKSLELDVAAKPTLSLALAALALEDPPLDLAETPR